MIVKRVKYLLLELDFESDNYIAEDGPSYWTNHTETRYTGSFRVKGNTKDTERLLISVGEGQNLNSLNSDCVIRAFLEHLHKKFRTKINQGYDMRVIREEDGLVGSYLTEDGCVVS